jgi:hypothetical protein
MELLPLAEQTKPTHVKFHSDTLLFSSFSGMPFIELLFFFSYST